MALTFAGLLTHVIFSTKDRQSIISAQFKHDLWAYVGGIARNLDVKALAVNVEYDERYF